MQSIYYTNNPYENLENIVEEMCDLHTNTYVRCWFDLRIQQENNTLSISVYVFIMYFSFMARCTWYKIMW